MEADLDGADLSRNDLAAEAIRALGALRLRVTGSSMLPAIWPGDVLVIRRCRVEEASPGEVVLFTRHRRLFAHRVVSSSGGRLVTQGDALAEPDPSVDPSELLGKVCQVLRRGKPIRTRSKMTFSARITAALVRRSARAGRLLMRMHGLRNGAGL